MRQQITIVLILITIIFSCKRNKGTSLPYNEGKTKANNTQDPYLLEKEIDSILGKDADLSKEKVFNQALYNIKIKRQQEIKELKRSATIHGKNKTPSVFNTYLTPKELSKFNSDSLSNWIIYNELYKTRRDRTSRLIKYVRALKKEEIQKFIQGSFKDSLYYKELASNRFKTDSIKSWVAYNKRLDSLQSIIHPIDSILPFGPKSLGKLIESNINDIGFTILKGDSLTKPKDIEARKAVYNTWKYFFKFHPYADRDLGEDYEERLLPPIKSYQYVTINDYSTLSNFKYLENKNLNSVIGSYVLRLPNINKYEVYYTTTGEDGYGNCGDYNKSEESCCFTESWLGCNSTGNIVLYNRKTQHSIVIAVFTLNALLGNETGTHQQFFYIDKNYTIHVFNGNLSLNRSYADFMYLLKAVGLTKTAEIKILEDGNIIINEECLFISGIDQEKYEKQGVRSVSIEYKVEEKDFIARRDSVINKIHPLITNYPFGATLLKTHTFPKEVFQNIKTQKKTNPHVIALDSVFKFYSSIGANYYKELENNMKIKGSNFYTLPFTQDINKIDLGSVEKWEIPFLHSFQKSWICNNTITAKEISNYKLPSIRNYEVYLSIYNSRTSNNNSYNGFKGVLTFYNTVDKTANIINVLEINDFYFRFFYINKDNQIEVYQGLKNQLSDSSNSDAYKINKTHIIEVLSNGEIKVIQQN